MPPSASVRRSKMQRLTSASSVASDAPIWYADCNLDANTYPDAHAHLDAASSSDRDLRAYYVPLGDWANVQHVTR